MSYSILPFLLIIIPIGIILFVVIRRFPQITLLDVDNLPEVKEEKKKDEVLRRRAEEHAAKTKKDLSRKLKPVAGMLKNVQGGFRSYVGKVQKRVYSFTNEPSDLERKPVSEKKIESAKNLQKEADNARQQEDLDSAEKKYLAAIRQDPKNIEAYRGLAAVYKKQGSKEEAKETYEFVLQLDPNDDDTLVKLAQIAEETGDTKSAIDYYQKAVMIGDHDAVRFADFAKILEGLGQHETALEAIKQSVQLDPDSEKYLDMMAEISIMGGHKVEAEEAYSKLRMKNPDNTKLAQYKDRISKL